jgi:hypothetical protein
MRPRTLLVLFVVVAGLLAFIWFVEGDLPSSEERREAAKKVLTVESADVREIVVERGDEIVRFRRQGGEGVASEGGGPAEGEEAALDLAAAHLWRLIEPLESRADEAAISRLLDTVTGLERQRSLTDFDAAAVGLSEPRARIRLISQAGEEVLLVGSDVPASSHLIVQRLGSEEAAVTPREVWTAIDKTPGEWRSRKLFTASSTEVVELRFQRGDRAIAMVRRAGDFWLESPVDDRARGRRVDEFLGTLLSLEAESFIDGAAAAGELGFDPPFASLEITPRGGRASQRLELGALVPQVVEPEGASAGGDGEAADDGGPTVRYARFEGQVVEVAEEMEEALGWEAADWQDDRWSAFDVWQVDNARIRVGGEEMVLARDGGAWRRGDETIGYGPVSDFLYAVDEASSEDLVDRALTSLGAPVVEIVLSGEDAEESLALYPAVEGHHPATVSGRDFALLLDSETVGDLLAKLEAVRTAEPEAEGADEAAGGSAG